MNSESFGSQSTLSEHPLHGQAGQYLAFIHTYTLVMGRAPGRSRHATPLPRHPAFGPPDGAHPRARRPDPATAGRRTQHQSPARSPAAAAAARQPRPAGHFLRAEGRAQGRQQPFGGRHVCRIRALHELIASNTGRRSVRRSLSPRTASRVSLNPEESHDPAGCVRRTNAASALPLFRQGCLPEHNECLEQ